MRPVPTCRLLLAPLLSLACAQSACSTNGPLFRVDCGPGITGSALVGEWEELEVEFPNNSITNTRMTGTPDGVTHMGFFFIVGGLRTMTVSQWDGVAWTDATTGDAGAGTSAPNKTGFAMAYDTQADRILVVGGTGIGALNDLSTWLFTPGAWEQGPDAPSSRSGGSAAYFEPSEQVIVFGGWDNETSQTLIPQTWIWDGSDWSVSGITGPPARIGHAMAYDEARQTIVLFGGRNVDDEVLGDTWLYADGAWTQAIPPQSPPPRQDVGLVYDPEHQVVVLVWANETWTWDGETWAQVPIVSEEAPVGISSLAAYDATTGAVLAMQNQTAWLLRLEEVQVDVDPGISCCGDGICADSESPSTCPADCS